MGFVVYGATVTPLSLQKTAFVFVNYITGTILVDATICYSKNNIVVKCYMFRPVSHE